MSKPARSFPRPLSDFLGATLNDTLKTQGFASTEIIARWADIAGPEIAAHSEPMKIAWPRHAEAETAEPATLVLRVEGPVALEIQHLAAVILERVNRFFGWQAIGRIALRQAPLRRRQRAKPTAAARSSRGGADCRRPPRHRGRGSAPSAWPPGRGDQAKVRRTKGLAGRPAIATIRVSS